MNLTGKNGSKLEVASGRRNYLNLIGPGRFTFTEMTSLLSLNAILANFLGAPVLDETGISGSYTYSLDFGDPQQTDFRPDLSTAVQEQLGLQLEAAKRPIEVVLIDHVERPTPN